MRVQPMGPKKILFSGNFGVNNLQRLMLGKNKIASNFAQL